MRWLLLVLPLIANAGEYCKQQSLLFEHFYQPYAEGYLYAEAMMMVMDSTSDGISNAYFTAMVHDIYSSGDTREKLHERWAANCYE